jgi:hypothetical protein
MHDIMVLDALFKNDIKKSHVGNFKTENIESDKCCDFCGSCPCVLWITQREAVIENDDQNENGHTFTIYNKTRRKIAYTHMFRAVYTGQVKKELGKNLQSVFLKLALLRALVVFPDEQAQCSTRVSRKSKTRVKDGVASRWH